jgi:cytosine/adenosine deaminase-related metal-dependent hydrolase
MAASKVILRSNWAWSNHKGWLQNVTVSMSDGKILNVATQKEPHKVVDCNILVPGFINSHCHLELSDLCGKLVGKQSFPKWVGELRKAIYSWGTKDFLISTKNGIEQASRTGTTTLVDVGNSTSTRQIKSPIRLYALHEVLGMDPNLANERIHNAKREPSSSKENVLQGFSCHAPYSNSIPLINRVLEENSSIGCPTYIHVAESPEEKEFFQKNSGELWDFTKYIYPKLQIAQKFKSAVAYLLAHIESAHDFVFVHGNHMGEQELKQVLNKGISLIHCPKSYEFFGYPGNFPLKEYIKRGLNIAIGTDSMASNDSLNIWDELVLLRDKHQLDFEDLLPLATRNGAIALKKESEIGNIQNGFSADLQGLSCSPEELSQLQKVEPTLVYFKGKIIYEN